MKKILIAGASSSVGHALIEKLLSEDDVEIIALSRKGRTSDHPRLIWKQCDLYSLKDIQLAVAGCEEAYYFAHAKDPSAALTQGAVADYELVMADNFARAARMCGLKHVYTDLKLFASPDEVGTTLKQSGVPTTFLDLDVSSREEAFPDEVPAKKDVRSIQRLVLPPGRNAEWVAQEYFNWLPRFFSTLVRVKIDGDLCIFYLVREEVRILVLRRSPERSSQDRQLLYVIGGVLAGKQERGRLEFREVLHGRYVLAALHEFRPALPWPIYKFTQAIVHLIVMRAFGEHLKWHIIKSGPLPQPLA